MSDYAMALFRDLCRAIAEVEGLSEMAVTGVGQYLRDASLISKHGRGRSAAQMTCEDAANLLIGLNGAQLAKDAAEAVNIFRGTMKLDECYPITADVADENGIFAALYRPRSPAVCLEKLIGCFVGEAHSPPEFNETSSPHISISFSRPIMRMSLRVEEQGGNEDGFPQLFALVEFEAVSAGTKFDKYDRTQITEKTIAATGRALSA